MSLAQYLFTKMKCKSAILHIYHLFIYILQLELFSMISKAFRSPKFCDRHLCLAKASLNVYTFGRGKVEDLTKCQINDIVKGLCFQLLALSIETLKDD